MDLEPEQIEEEWYNDETNHSSAKVLAECWEIKRSSFSVDIKQIPQVDRNGTTDSQKDEKTNIFCRDHTAHIETRQQKPFPPFSSKRIVTLLVESDIAVNACGHKEDQSCVEKNQTSLTNV